MKKEAVAIYAGSIPATTFIENLIQGMADTGHCIYLFGSLKKRPAYAGYRNVFIYATPQHKWSVIGFVLWRQLCLLFRSPKRFRQLRQHIRSIKKTPHQTWRLWAKYLPVVLNLPAIFHIQWAKATEEWCFLKEIFGVKLILSLRGTHINYSPLTDAALIESYRQSFPKVDGFHAVSQAIAQEAVRWGADRQKIKVVYSGLNLETIGDFRKQFYELDEPVKLLSVGRFHWIKGYSYALDALKLLTHQGHQVHYTIIAGGEVEEILYQIQDLNLQNCVKVIQHLPQAEVFRHMQAADMLLLPSVEEGIANVVLEAMAIGLPVVSSDCGGMTEVIEDGKNGFLFPNRSVSGMAESIKALMTLSAFEREKMAIEGRNKIMGHYSMERLSTEMIELYQCVLASS